MKELLTRLGFVCTIAAAGCQTQYRMLETSGDLRVEKSTAPGSDYVVTMQNKRDFKLDPDDENSRHSTALSYLKSQCPNGRVVDDQSIETGSFATGRPARTYSVYIKCG